MRRALTLGLTLSLFSVGCASEGPAVSVAELHTLQDAAEMGELHYGVPASLTLAVGYTETRWQLPDAGADADHHGMPTPVGVGGLRPWLASDPVGTAAAELGVDAERLADDPAVSLLATAVVLRAMADARGEAPAADDPGAWVEVLGDYAGLENEGARQSYADEVFRWMRVGASGLGADGSHVVLHSGSVRLPDGIGATQAYGGAEYSMARWVPASSTNYSSRTAAIDHIIIHTTQGSYAGAISWFQNPAADVSAHYVIRSSDGEITQMVHERDKAWHVGNYNSRSIGIEHEGYVADPGRWYTDAMYRSSAALVRHLCTKYGIPMDRSHIIGHSEAPGATHTDPGSGWDWGRYMDMVRGVPEGPAYDASYSGQSVPAEMTSGDREVAWVEMRNDGRATWSLDNTRIGTSAPQDHASPFFDAENWMNDHRASGADHSDYSTGRVGRFTFMVTAPEVTEDTTITDTFRLVQEGVTWFGPEVTLSILVHPRAVVGPVDEDGDGSPADVDCDDADASVHPGATDLCGDGVDADCDGVDPMCEPMPEPDAGTGMGMMEPDGGTGGGGSERPLGAEGCAVSPSGGGATGLWLVLAGLVVVARRRRVRSAA
ncbi:MAG: N-acetylmuramoyl-L-alanine amidase [Sandaracinaceae bacterium]|nr:N-acetylmuramoyl-L-alanine amidase [Sandaracinaceae bacterium]